MWCIGAQDSQANKSNKSFTGAELLSAEKRRAGWRMSRRLGLATARFLQDLSSVSGSVMLCLPCGFMLFSSLVKTLQAAAELNNRGFSGIIFVADDIEMDLMGYRKLSQRRSSCRPQASFHPW